MYRCRHCPSGTHWDLRDNNPRHMKLIRISADVCGPYSAIVNGSIMVVPPGTTAFVAINGTLSRPYGPGRYEIFTGVDPFFVRFRNILTRGDTGTTVSVFFVSTERTKFVKLGTGEFPFREHRFHLTMKARFQGCHKRLKVQQFGGGYYSSTLQSMPPELHY
jgi:membrane protease subunit (stomatin/prohibitin family)